MTKTLFLVRHAKSDWSVTGQRDFDRELNGRGHRDAPRMGRFLADKGVRPGLIICSPAQRTTQTVEYLIEQLGYELEAVQFDERLYEASTRILLDVVNRLDDSLDTVMLVGHNPGFTYLAEYLTGAEVGNIPTCGVVQMHAEVNSWAEISARTLVLDWLETPKKLEGWLRE